MANENNGESTKLGPKKFETLFIGIGQGGSKLALSMAQRFNATDDVCFFNTSWSDLNGLENVPIEKLCKIGMNEIEGSGKDREASKNILGNYYTAIINKATEAASKKEFDFIFISFSSSGGTGSGMGPDVTALLNSDEFLDSLPYALEKKPLVFGICITPEISDLEGTKSLKNTMLTLENINKHVNNLKTGYPIARFLLVTNGVVTTKDKGRQSSQYVVVNKMVGDMLYRYLYEYGHSRLSNLDRADRLKSLETMGLHAFGSLVVDASPLGKYYTTGTTPFIIPEGERVRAVTYEVGEDQEEDILSYFKDYSGLAVDDFIHGFFDKNWEGNKNFTPIIGFHGFRNIAKITEKFADRFRKITNDDARREKENILSARGLDNISKTLQTTKDEHDAKYGKSYLDILGS